MFSFFAVDVVLAVVVAAVEGEDVVDAAVVDNVNGVAVVVAAAF